MKSWWNKYNWRKKRWKENVYFPLPSVECKVKLLMIPLFPDRMTPIRKTKVSFYALSPIPGQHCCSQCQTPRWSSPMWVSEFPWGVEGWGRLETIERTLIWSASKIYQWAALIYKTVIDMVAFTCNRITPNAVICHRPS